MKKFQFSLEKVLSYKNQTIDVLKNELATLQHSLNQLEDELLQLKQLFVDTNKTVNGKMIDGISSGNISVYKIYLNDITVQVRNKNHEIAKMEKLIADKQQEVIAMNIEIASLDKLKQSQWEEYQKASAKAFEQEIEEFISNKI
ncbi:MAG: flagellar export protein FliJ [Oscillospiraceae bacterium]